MSPAFKTGMAALTVCFVFGIIIVVALGDPRLPPYDQGYEPVQPIAFSHRVHAGDLQIGCLHCHTGAEKSRHAGIPPMQTCLNCHRFVTSSQNDQMLEEALAIKENREMNRVVSPEIRKIYNSAGFNQEIKPDSSLVPAPVKWIRVHTLPDFVYFDHSRHVNRGIDCGVCHGPVETMERIRQTTDLSMGFCVNCHRQENAKSTDANRTASIDCDACHF